MKKVLVLLVGMFFIAGLATADIGVDYEYNIKQEVELENIGIEAEISGSFVNLIAALPLDFMTLTLKGGLATSEIAIDSPIGEIELDSGIGWNVGADVEAIVLETNIADLGLIGSYRFTRVDIDEIDIAGITIDNSIETILSTHSYEAGVSLSKKLGDVSVYVACVYSDLIGDIDVNLSSPNLNEDIRAIDNIGIRAGLSGGYKDFSVNVEGAFLDKQAIIGSLSYKF